VRNKSNFVAIQMVGYYEIKLHYRPTMILWVKGLSMSIHVGTRKMVNYAWVGWSQGKLWWRSVEILTCKLIFKLGY